MAQALSQISKQDLLDALDRSRNKLAKFMEDNNEVLARTTTLGVGASGGGLGAFLDKKYPNLALGPMGMPLALGALAAVAGVMDYGGNKETSDLLVAAGTGMLAWEFGKYVYQHTEGPKAETAGVGAVPYLPPYAQQPPATRYAPGYGAPGAAAAALPPPVGYAPALPAPTAPRFAEAPARAITLDEVHAHLAQMGLSL